MTKIQQIALQMLQENTAIIRSDKDTQTKLIIDACEFASLFVRLSEDKEMTWNK